MARIVLLGLGNEDVDVLTRLASLDPSPEVLAVHPDPEALILRLAAVASYPALTEPPRPREDDVVVVPSMRGPLDAQMVRPWREIGARILLPDAPALSDLAVHLQEQQAPVLTGAGVGEREARGAMGGSGAGDTLSKPREQARSTEVTASASDSGTPGGDTPPAASSDAPPEAAPQPAPRPSDSAGRAAGGPAPAEPSSREPAAEPAEPPVSAWDSPEATFRYLAEQVFGTAASVALWWDGDAGVWVPWVWIGSAPAGREDAAPKGVEIPSRWGSFRLATEAQPKGEIPVKAFARVAEDFALRDLMAWREEAGRFADLGRPEPEADAAAVRRWVEPLLARLEAPSALLWKRDGDRYRLVHAAGEGLELSGSLAMPAAMVAAAFEGPDSGWRRWEPVPGLTLHFATAEADPRLPLRLRRLESALAGETARW